jgi:hypothetical protein
MSRRKHKRFRKRVEVEFRVGGRVLKGTSSDVSENGIFIRTRNSLVPGSPVEMTLYMPDGNVSKVKGLVRRSVKTSSNIIKNGMGIEILEYDRDYGAFLKGLFGGLRSPDLAPDEPLEPDSEDVPEAAPPEDLVIDCPSCGVKNKLATANLSLSPRCGKCGEPLLKE